MKKEMKEMIKEKPEMKPNQVRMSVIKSMKKRIKTILPSGMKLLVIWATMK